MVLEEGKYKGGYIVPQFGVAFDVVGYGDFLVWMFMNGTVTLSRGKIFKSIGVLREKMIKCKGMKLN